jgi:hypothetical protein
VAAKGLTGAVLLDLVAVARVVKTLRKRGIAMLDGLFRHGSNARVCRIAVVRRPTLAAFLISAAAFGTVVASRAAEGTVINLTYDSIMDMVRPEIHPGITVHHDLTVTLSGRNQVSESRSRNTKNLSDRNSAAQVLSSSGDGSSYTSWHIAPGNRFVRIQRDPQSTRTLTVTLTSDTTCDLEVEDHLKPGFNEYAFLRISSHTIGYFSSYHVTSTSCTIH